MAEVRKRLCVEDVLQRLDDLAAENKMLRERVAKLENAVVQLTPYKPNAFEVKHVRDSAGCGLLEARNAVVACRGDLMAAIEWLNRRGLA